MNERVTLLSGLTGQTGQVLILSGMTGEHDPGITEGTTIIRQGSIVTTVT